MKLFGIAVCIFGLGVVAANGVLMASTTDPSVYLDRALDAKWSSTVAILGEEADGTRYFAGSGTVLSDPYSNDEYVWGAAHSADQEYVRYHAVNGTDLYNGFGQHYITDASMVTIDSRYNGTIRSFDQMLIRYEGGLDDIDGLNLYTGPTVAGTMLEACGYGNPATLVDGELAWDGKKRSFQMSVHRTDSAFGDQYSMFVFDSNSIVEAHGVGSHGDSGGTVLNEDGFVWGQMTWTSPADSVQNGQYTGILEASGNDWVYDTMYSIAVANGASNNVPIAWLEGMGYTNEFDVAALDDPDGDDFANWQEYHADTIPTNGNDYLMLGMASNQLVFASSSNCIYEVQWNDNLSSNVWNSLTNDLAGTGGDLNVTDTNNVPVRFYRLNAERVSQ